MFYMSVFPKHIVKGDNVVIHVKIDNYSLINLPVAVSLIVVDQLGNYHKRIVDSKFYVVPAQGYDGHGIIERYFVVHTNNKMPLGKYDCLLSIKYLNKERQSLTRKNAFFYIEQLKITRKLTRVFVENLSNCHTKIKIFLVNKVCLRNLKPLETISIKKADFLYLVYANNDVLC